MKKTMLALALALLSADLAALSTTSYYTATAFDPEQRATVPRVEDLNFKLEFPAELAQVEAKNFDNDLDYEPASEKKIYYFTKEGRELNAPGPWPFQQPKQLLGALLGQGLPRVAASPQPGGYYREILGKTSDGSLVAQDFYQDSGKVQTAPFLLGAGHEEDFSSDGNNGRVVRFGPNGQVIDVGNFKDGQLQGWLLRVDDGQFMEAHNPEKKLVLLLDRAGRPRVSMDKDQVIYYYSNGAAMLRIKGEEEQAWDRDGREIATQQLDPQLLREAVGRVDQMFKRAKLEEDGEAAGDKSEELPPPASALIRDLPTDLLNIDPLTYKNGLDYQPASEEKIYYFAKDSEQALAGADGSYYYRKILGTTKDGQTVAQDFYRSGADGDKKPQTAPFLLRPGHEEDFSIDCIASGPMLWYGEEDGSPLDSYSTFKDGRAVGWSFQFRRGQLFFATDNEDKGQLLGFQDNRVAIYMDRQAMTYYYEDGQPMALSEGEKVRVWDRDGKERKSALDLELFRRRVQLLKEILNHLRDNGTDKAESEGAELEEGAEPRQLQDFFTEEFPQGEPAPPSYSPSSEEIIYFDGRGQPSERPEATGYRRKILGKTSGGQTVVQDFYGDGSRQSGPFLLQAGQERNFTAASVADGTVAFYDRGGQLQALTSYRAGRPSGWHYLFKAGKPFLARRGHDYLLFNGAGQATAYFAGGDQRYHLFYPDGREQAELDFSGRPLHFWAEDGREQPVSQWPGTFKESVVQPLVDYFNNREEP